MLRNSMKTAVGVLGVFAFICAGLTSPVLGQGGGGQGVSLVFDVNWTQPPSQDGQTKLVQENIGDSSLELKQYGLHANCLLTSGTPGNEARPFSVWSGECERPFATMFRHRDSFVDLTGGGKIRWAVKTSGFHVVRPIVKLADGTMLVGDYASESIPVLAMSEFLLEPLNWAQIDPERLVTLGQRGAAFASIWVQNPDLSRVDEVGFVDLMPASGHGTGGYIHVSQFQVYGRSVPRAGGATASR